jgi:hypothetical protein
MTVSGMMNRIMGGPVLAAEGRARGG